LLRAALDQLASGRRGRASLTPRIEMDGAVRALLLTAALDDDDVIEYLGGVLAEAAADPDEGPLTAERVADVAGPFLEEGQLDEAGVAALCEKIAALYAAADTEPEPEPEPEPQQPEPAQQRTGGGSVAEAEAEAAQQRRLQRLSSPGAQPEPEPEPEPLEPEPEPEPVSAEDRELQEEEAAVLESIFGDAFHRCGEGGWELDLTLEVPAPLVIEWPQTAQGDGREGGDGTAGQAEGAAAEKGGEGDGKDGKANGEAQERQRCEVTYLPPLTLGVDCTPGYPSAQPPQFA